MFTTEREKLKNKANDCRSLSRIPPQYSVHGLGGFPKRNLINYFCQLALPEDFKESDARLLVNTYNSKLPLVKTYYQSNKNKSNINIIFRYEYALLEHDTVNPKTLVRLHRLFQETIENSAILFRELFAKHNN